MQVSQNTFRAALLDKDMPVPDGLTDGAGAPAGRRYGVYRNNVTHSLIEAMKVAFPTVRTLLGAQNFDTLVPMFVRANPPRSPVLMHYGDAFPAFLDAFQPLAHLGYLADVARLDLALRTSYHAKDTLPFDPSVLQQSPDVLAPMRLHLAASTLVLRSRWPLFDLWQRASDANAPEPRPMGQAILITRPEYDPQVALLPVGAATWLTRLETETLGDAVEAAVSAAPDFDFSASLTLALQTAAFCAPEKDT